MDTTKKLLRSFLFSLSFASFSVALKPSEEPQNQSLIKPSPISELVEVNRKILKEVAQIDDINHKDLGENLRGDLERLHETASELKQKTGKLLKSHKNQRRSFWDSMFEEMEESQKAFGQFFSDIQKNFKTKSLSTKEYRVQESIGNDGKTYIVSLALPNFNQEELKVSIEESKRNGQPYNVLKISAKKNDEKKSEPIEENTTMIHHSSHQVASQYVINGRRLSTNFKDGKLEASVDLPATAQPEKYNMTFDSGTLKIEFENVTKNTATRTLEFKKKERSQEESDK